MEYFVFAAAAVAFLLFVFVQGVYNEKKMTKWFKNKLKNQFGQAPEKEYKPERFVRIPGYYEKHRVDSQIDDITWNDLGMDDIFMRMDYTLSSTGEEYLYYHLRTPQFDLDRLKHFDSIVDFFAANENARIEYQMLMRKLGNTGKYSLYDYIEYLNSFGKQSNTKEILKNVLLLAGILLMFVNLSFGIVLTVGMMAYQIADYYKVKKRIEPYITSLVYMMRLEDAAEQVLKLKNPVCQEEYEKIRRHVKNLSRAKRGNFWVFHNSGMSTGGNPLDIFLVYVTMIMHVDLICFNRLTGELIDHMDDIDELVGVLGYLETAISVALFRASMTEGVCKPELAGEELALQNGYHPMITAPVKNSIIAEKSVLLTGSNASGKSTFLKMVALNVLLAQTIYTVCADEYKAPVYRLYSSMSLRDDLESGDSYYIVEIKAIKRIMEQKNASDVKIICFVDEVLRGTNTTERIAASSQILKSLAKDNVLCFAATHDIELTDLLSKEFDNYHFEEEIVDDDILFNYLLKPGKATTKNAIRLLQLMGYEEEIIECASRQARIFEESGIWKLT